MQVRISGQHFDISDRIREHVEGETTKFERFYGPVVDVQVTIRQEGNRFAVDMIAGVPNQTLKSSGAGDKVYPAIDAAAEKMVRQLKKLHDKRLGHRPDSAEPPLAAKE